MSVEIEFNINPSQEPGDPPESPKAEPVADKAGFSDLSESLKETGKPIIVTSSEE